MSGSLVLPLADKGNWLQGKHGYTWKNDLDEGQNVKYNKIS